MLINELLKVRNPGELHRLINQKKISQDIIFEVIQAATEIGSLPLVRELIFYVPEEVDYLLLLAVRSRQISLVQYYLLRDASLKAREEAVELANQLQYHEILNYLKIF